MPAKQTKHKAAQIMRNNIVKTRKYYTERVGIW